jgi:mannose-6-phosphate isomerase-like protein (cupin superfamily)
MTTPNPPTLTRPQDMAALPFPPGRISKQVFEAADLELRHYAPPQPDPQQPHARDELYFVISGNGSFFRAGERVRFVPGDVLFVAAGEEHRFEDCSPETATWVVFYGPERT